MREPHARPREDPVRTARTPTLGHYPLIAEKFFTAGGVAKLRSGFKNLRVQSFSGVPGLVFVVCVVAVFRCGIND